MQPRKVCSTLAAALCVLSINGAAARSSESGFDYFVTGDPADVVKPTAGGLLLVGGGKDIDAAFAWLIKQSGGGDVVVIRASGTDAYNPYIYGLGKVNSVETIVFKSRAAAGDPFVLDKIRHAEALFIAGGDQSNYLKYWQGTPVAAAVNDLAARHVPIGGT